MQTTGNLGLKKPEGTDVVDIADLNGNADILDTAVSNKVDKVAGKQLSTEDYTTAEKTKLAGVAAGANAYVHPANHPASVIIQDASNRFVTDAEKTAWNAKASTAVATTSTAGLQSAADKVKLDGIAAGANNYTHPSTHAASMITVADAGNIFTATNVEGALSELFISASNGKTAVAAAVTGMGQAATGSDTHAQLAAKISAISTDANAPVAEVLLGKTYYQGGTKKTGTMPNRAMSVMNGGYTTALSVKADAGGNLVMETPTGYYTAGVNANGYGSVIANDPDFIAANIKAGVNVFGVNGTYTEASNGQYAKTVLAGENISVNDPIYSRANFPMQYNRPGNYTANKPECHSDISSDGNFLAMCTGYTDGPTYVWTDVINGTFTPCTINDMLVGALRVSFSPNANYMFLSGYYAPFGAWYKRTGNTFNKLANPASWLLGSATGASWSPDGNCLAVTYESAIPYLHVFRRFGDVLVKLADLPSLPTSTAGSASPPVWSPNGKMLVTGLDNNVMYLYYRPNMDSDAFSYRPSPFYGSYARAFAFSPDNGFIIMLGNNSSPRQMANIDANGNMYRFPDDQVVLDGSFYQWYIWDAEFSPDGNYLYVLGSMGNGAQGGLLVYKRTGASTFIQTNLSKFQGKFDGSNTNGNSGIAISKLLPDGSHIIAPWHSANFSTQTTFLVHKVGDWAWRSSGGNWAGVATLMGKAQQNIGQGTTGTAVITHN
ncbi:WD40 repeat domain-containing protein [Paenibacillus sp. MCAF9]|uniref:WD40 repeat domain-containing protein n=1 Tax=Paenibacillus sp. MCAF9 TaxID=3233046 RepID=UPI003F9C6C34